MKLKYLGLLTACTSFTFATAPSSIDDVTTAADFEAYQRGWHQDGVTDAATHLTKFKSPDGNQIWRVAMPHQPCIQTQYCLAGEGLTVHRMRFEMTVDKPWQVVYYAMKGRQKLAVMREILGENKSTLRISANTVSAVFINERALALSAIACKRLSIEQAKLGDDDSLDYQVFVQLDVQIGEEEAKIAEALTTAVQAGQFARNINITSS
ncbi:MAG: hypothetical protein COY39_00780 [Alphaproteobacteria bacterium CG_4_10_14_0_8_um_filter_37_21]|nr:MAG: hypothetical protein COY39_00780 [Alphaproteobacteria bacterium CG_4_10_14_0_8_um_filter_37_21]